MTSEVWIANLALASVASTERIEAFTDATKAAELCGLFYPQARDAALERFPWPFAVRRAALAGPGNLEAPEEWGYAFAVPIDCVLPLGLADGKTSRSVDDALPWAVENYGADLPGQDIGCRLVLFAKIPDPVLLYVSSKASPARFTPGFVAALAWGLAGHLAVPLTADLKRADYCRQRYEVELAGAMASCGSVGFRGPDPETDSMAARR